MSGRRVWNEGRISLRDAGTHIELTAGRVIQSQLRKFSVKGRFSNTRANKIKSGV
jgi:hypothetical protein